MRHPHAVDVTDIGSEAGQTFLVMELLEGEDLASFIEWRGRLPLEQAADIMLPVAAAVAAAHDEGIIHRDLKPHNIFLSQTRDGAIVPKVVDFGISKGPTDPQSVAGLTTSVMTPLVQTTVGLMGTPAFLVAGTDRGANGQRRERPVRAWHHPLSMRDGPPARSRATTRSRRSSGTS